MQKQDQKPKEEDNLNILGSLYGVLEVSLPKEQPKEKPKK